MLTPEPGISLFESWEMLWKNTGVYNAPGINVSALLMHILERLLVFFQFLPQLVDLALLCGLACQLPLGAPFLQWIHGNHRI